MKRRSNASIAISRLFLVILNEFDQGKKEPMSRPPHMIFMLSTFINGLLLVTIDALDICLVDIQREDPYLAVAACLAEALQQIYVWTRFPKKMRPYHNAPTSNRWWYVIFMHVSMN
jgi:hypothetical protein